MEPQGLMSGRSAIGGKAMTELVRQSASKVVDESASEGVVASRQAKVVSELVQTAGRRAERVSGTARG